MSGHGKRETILRANATRWRDRVCADMATATGCAALSKHRLSIQFVNDEIDAIAGCVAAGDDLVVNDHFCCDAQYGIPTCDDVVGCDPRLREPVRRREFSTRTFRDSAGRITGTAAVATIREGH
jgi:hypothetical protein